MERFTMIRGGKSGDLINTSGCSKKIFRDIRIAFRMAERTSTGPAFGTAVVVFLAVFLGFVGLVESAKRLGFILQTSASIGWLPASIALAVAIWVYRRHPFKSWTQKIYALLADYDPADKAAYAKLQASTRDHGLTRETMIDWLHSEEVALNGYVASSNDTPMKRFLKKRI